MEFATEDDQGIYSRLESMLQDSTTHMISQDYNKAIDSLLSIESQVLQLMVW